MTLTDPIGISDLCHLSSRRHSKSAWRFQRLCFNVDDVAYLEGVMIQMRMRYRILNTVVCWIFLHQWTNGSRQTNWNMKRTLKSVKTAMIYRSRVEDSSGFLSLKSASIYKQEPRNITGHGVRGWGKWCPYHIGLISIWSSNPVM